MQSKEKSTIVNSRNHNSREQKVIHSHLLLVKALKKKKSSPCNHQVNELSKNINECNLGWVQEIVVMANKALTDWYNVKASFCISDPAKCKRWG